jgi:hypothetical protein
MNKPGLAGEALTERTLDHELDLIRGAIALVALGDAPRVGLAGLRFGEQLLERANRMAAEAGVRIVPNWTSDEGGGGLTVERTTDG